MISDNTKKDLFWYLLALLVVVLHLVTVYFIVLTRSLGILYGGCFLAVAGFMWCHHEESGLGPHLLVIIAIIPIGHGRISLELTGWIAVKELLFIYGLGFGPAFLIWVSKKTHNFFHPEEKRI